MRNFALLFALTAVCSAADNQWNIGHRAIGDESVSPIFMLRHDKNTLAAFEQTLWAVSTPGSVRYGKHLSRTEAHTQLPPMHGAKEAVLAMLKSHGVTHMSVSPSGDMIQATMNVNTAEAMFQTELHHFTHRTRGWMDVIRASKPVSVDSTVASKLYLVGDLVELPAIRSAKAAVLPEDSTDGAWPQACGNSCKSSVTPPVLMQAYGIEATSSGSNTTMSVSEFQGVSWDQADLTHFQTQCALPQNITVDRLVGTNGAWKCKIPLIGEELCTEALLDVEYIKAVGGDIPLVDVSDNSYSLLNWAKQLDAMDDLPPVHSVSYGNDEVQQSTPAYMDACNAQFMKLGARGVSILFASGDQGVYGRSGVGTGRFHPDFPASSPYITAVGGTDFNVKTTIGAEKAWSDGGGGFSDHFPIPAYQKAAVESYKTAATAAGVLPSQTFWNNTGRGYPDVAALGGEQNPYCVAATLVAGSMMLGVAGTSASCPVVSGVIARLNALRATQGQPAMGFLNPFIYQNPQAFNDVEIGSNTGGGPHGFPAIKGWDAATGLGTPNFPKLKAAAIQALGQRVNIVV